MMDAQGKTAPELPMVSVIIPVYNDAVRLEKCLGALSRQDYPADRYEIIVVNNMSSDASPSVAVSAGATVLAETSTQSSYAARNRGVEAAKGSVFAFTDSDCIPTPQWISEGVESIASGADLVGGRVEFVFAGRPSGAELFDSISNMQVEINVRERHVAKTANLFARRAVFDDIGEFAAHVKSGGDVMWTGQATSSGYGLAYSDTAVVQHPARTLRALASKQFRVGTGQPQLRMSNASRLVAALRSAGGAIRRLETPKYLNRRLRESGRDVGFVMLTRVWFTAVTVRIAMAFGNLSTLRPKHL